MLVSNYTARSGLIAQQQRLDTIANNIANVNTLGFKGERADFKDMVYQTQVRVQQPQTDLNMQKGHGVLLGATTRDFGQGAMQYSGYQLDFYLEGDGFFAVEGKDSSLLFTRDGSFALSVESNGNYLVTQSGHYLLDADGKRINIQDCAVSDLSVGQDGSIYIKKYTAATETEEAREEIVNIGKFGLVHFTNRAGLTAVSSNLYAATDNSGEPFVETTTKVMQGSTEMSNVEISNEMVRMIRAQRAYSLAGKLLTTADEMDAKAIQIRG